MSPLVIVVVTFGAAAAVALAPVRRGLPILAGAILLVPASLVVPNGVSGLPTVVRVVLLATALATVVAAARGRLTPGALRPTPIHALALAIPLVALVVGVGFGLPLAPLREAASAWFRFLDGAIVLVVVVALARASDDLRRVRWAVTAIVLIAATIGVAEHVTGASWGRFLFSELPSQQATDAASPLGFRGGRVRVRAGAEFALEFGWLLVALLPMALVGLGDLARRWRWLAPVLVALPLAAIFWTYARTALAATLPVLVLSALLVRERWHVTTGGVIVAGAMVAVVTTPAVLIRHALRADVGSIEVRVDRLPEILALASTRPFAGLGLGSLTALGYPVADSSYLSTYAEVGAIGLAVLVTAVVVVTGAVVRGAVAPRSEAQRTAGAAAAGLVALAGSALTYDTFHLGASAATFWLLAGIGLAAAERAGRPVAWPAARWGRRLAVPVAAAAVGFVGAAVAPVVWVGNYTFTTLPTELETRFHTQDHIGRPLVGSVCGLVEVNGGRIGDTWIDCYREISAEGVGRLHVVGPHAGAVVAGVRGLGIQVAEGVGIGSFRVYPDAEIAPSLPTVIRTAPAWAAVGALGLVLVRPLRAPVRGPA